MAELIHKLPSDNNLQHNRDNDIKDEEYANLHDSVIEKAQKDDLTGTLPPNFYESLGCVYNVYIEHNHRPSTTSSLAGTSDKNSDMDAFDIRMKFNGLLTHLNASVTSANKAAQFALKHKAQGEDLHNVILESLEQVSFPPFM